MLAAGVTHEIKNPWRRDREPRRRIRGSRRRAREGGARPRLDDVNALLDLAEDAREARSA
jgi:hypothetical protein